jgi:hypothetical protein
MTNPYLSTDNSDILRWVGATDDRTLRYFIFKVNADHLLIHTAVFDDIGMKPRQQILRRSLKHYHELAKLYYGQAATYHQRIYRKKTGVGEVLQKLSHYYDMYQKMLYSVRREYFNFLNSFRDQAFHSFLNEIHRLERELKKKDKMDEFLDLYGQWLKTRNREIEMQIRRIISELKIIDPYFDFHFPSEGESFDERKAA